MKNLTKRQRRVLGRLQGGWWLKANIDRVQMGCGDEYEKVLRNTFDSLYDRKLITFSGRRRSGYSYYEMTSAGFDALFQKDKT